MLPHNLHPIKPITKCDLASDLICGLFLLTGTSLFTYFVDTQPVEDNRAEDIIIKFIVTVVCLLVNIGYWRYHFQPQFRDYRTQNLSQLPTLISTLGHGYPQTTYGAIASNGTIAPTTRWCPRFLTSTKESSPTETSRLVEISSLLKNKLQK